MKLLPTLIWLLTTSYFHLGNYFAQGSALEAGGSLSCAIVAEGCLKCWGGIYGLSMTGNGQCIDLGTGRSAVGLSVAGTFDSRRHCICVILDNGATKCWDEADTPNDHPPVNLGTNANVTAVATHWSGLGTKCAILSDGRVKCWGSNSYGQLGLGHNTSIWYAPQMGDALPAVDLGTRHTVLAIAVGYFHSCAILGDGSLKCWGQGSYIGMGITNSSYHIGDEPGEMGDNLHAVDLGSGKRAVSVSIGVLYTCVIAEDGTTNSVMCFGYGDRPFRVDTTRWGVARAISVGAFQECVLFEGGAVVCWGSNTYGQLGLGHTQIVSRQAGPSSTVLSIPVDLGTGMTALSITAGYRHFCAMLNTGSVKCWGLNDYNQLGYDNTTNNRGDEPGEMGDNLPTVDIGSVKGPTCLISQNVL